MGIFKKKFSQQDIEKLWEEENVESLIKAVKDKDKDVRADAAEALGKIEDPRAVEPLIQALKDKDEDVRTDAAEALGKIGDPRAVEPLLQALNDKDEYVRIHAAEALGKIGDPRAVEPLLQALNDKDDRIPGCAAEALGKIGDPRAAEPLIQALEGKSTVQQWEAIEALGNLGDERAIVPLIKLIKDDSACRSLIKIGKSAVGPLIESLKDESAEVRKTAAAILGSIGDSRAVDPLIEVLNDVDRFVRCTAAMNLGVLRDKRAAEPLIQALKDVPYEARLALERLGEAAAEALNQALEDENQNIKSDAKKILEKLEETKVEKQIVTTQESTATPKASEAAASELRPSDDKQIIKKKFSQACQSNDLELFMSIWGDKDWAEVAAPIVARASTDFLRKLASMMINQEISTPLRARAAHLLYQSIYIRPNIKDDQKIRTALEKATYDEDWFVKTNAKESLLYTKKV